MDRKRLLIIQPSHYRSRTERTVHRIRKRTVVGLSLPYLAALTPKEWEVTLIDELLTEIDFNAPVDVVAITTLTINSLRTYEIADAFKIRRVPVLIGGPHTCFYSEEAAEHCDAVGIGEGEKIWPTMLKDVSEGRLKKMYRSERAEELKHLPFPRYDLVDLRRHSFFKTFSVQTSRGCPFKCEFCSERFYLGYDYRYRPVQEVVEEIKQVRCRNILFVDSNFVGKIEHTMELLEALIPLKLRWSALWSAYLCNNRDFMDLAKKSGLLHVNIGMESLDQKTLIGMNKRANKVEEYKEFLHNLRKRGISFSLNFIFGWDTEDVNVFDNTLRFLQEEKVPVAYFNILTPHRGTPLYDRMKKENRILDDYQVGRWPGLICYIAPNYCSPDELEEYTKDLHQRFYSFSSMIKRLPPPITTRNIASWVVNLSQRRVYGRQGQAENFDSY